MLKTNAGRTGSVARALVPQGIFGCSPPDSGSLLPDPETFSGCGRTVTAQVLEGRDAHTVLPQLIPRGGVEEVPFVDMSLGNGDAFLDIICGPILDSKPAVVELLHFITSDFEYLRLLHQSV